MVKYLKIIISIALVFSMAGAFNSCNDYVQDIEDPISSIGDEDMNIPSDVPFLVKGVQTAFSIVWDETSCFAGGLSDELGFSTDIKQATFPTFEAIDSATTGILLPQNNSTEAIMDQLAQLRLYADTLITRVNEKINFSEDEMDIKNSGLFTGYFFSAVARYMWAAYWALEPDQPGGVINVSPLIPDTQLYNDALSRLDEALNYASDAQKPMIYTMKARIHMILGEYTLAKTAADMGMTSADAPFSALYNTIENNYWYYWSGPGRTQFHIDPRFNDYVTDNPQEAARIPIYQIPAGEVYSDVTYYQQAKYTSISAGIEFLTWEENHLMLAELAIRDNDDAGGLALVNEVRAAYGIDDLTAQDVDDMFGGNYLDMIFEERDKQLCFTGMRLIDQRRFDKWHLDPGTWKHFPISYDERNANPNID